MPRGSNLPAGGRSTSPLRIDDDGIGRYKALINAIPKKMEKNIRFVHIRRSADLYRIAKASFNNERRRPTSSGDRPGDRMTGRFTFGSGGAFKAVIFERKGGKEQGIGFPDVDVADSKTNYVWRVHEYGLGAKVRPGPYQPQGDHRLPSAFHFNPNDPERRDAILMLGKDPKDRYRRKGKRSSRLKRENTDRIGYGVLAKNRGEGFVEPAFREFEQTVLKKEYRKLVDEAFDSVD